MQTALKGVRKCYVIPKTWKYAINTNKNEDGASTKTEII